MKHIVLLLITIAFIGSLKGMQKTTGQKRSLPIKHRQRYPEKIIKPANHCNPSERGSVQIIWIDQKGKSPGTLCSVPVTKDTQMQQILHYAARKQNILPTKVELIKVSGTFWRVITEKTLGEYESNEIVVHAIAMRYKRQ